MPSSLTELIQKGSIEWFVHLPHLFEKYVRRRLGALLVAHPSLRHLEVIKPRGVPHKHFADKTANPDVLVRDAVGNAVALYDVKLYRKASLGPQNNHHHQVESDVLSFNAAEAEEGRRGNIVHAGLIYGFWEVGEGFGSEEWKRGCYHACVRGEAAAVENAIGYALEKLVQELADVYHP